MTAFLCRILNESLHCKNSIRASIGAPGTCSWMMEPVHRATSTDDLRCLHITWPYGKNKSAKHVCVSFQIRWLSELCLWLRGMRGRCTTKSFERAFAFWNASLRGLPHCSRSVIQPVKWRASTVVSQARVSLIMTELPVKQLVCECGPWIIERNVPDSVQADWVIESPYYLFGFALSRLNLL